jgi:hypothetical protein
VIVFLDTEFTDLVVQPRLLSVGLVTGAGHDRELYAEVTDRDRIHAASWFALDAVLPQFGKVAHAACTYAALGVRLSDFFVELMASLEAAESIELAFGYYLDWDLMELAVRDSTARGWESTRRRLCPVNVYGITGVGAGALAAGAYFKSQANGPLSRHHALCDARALRLAYEAACPGPLHKAPSPQRDRVGNSRVLAEQRHPTQQGCERRDL